MTRTATDVLNEARKEIGYDEQVGNRTKFAAEAGHPNGQAWCATFISAILIRCGVMVKGNKILSPSSRTMYATAKQKGWAVPFDRIQPGDVIHTWRGVNIGRWFGHVGFVEHVTHDAKGRVITLRTIEGNTNGAGSATGGEVLRKVRFAAFWRLGAWRPPYAKPSDR